MIIAHPPSSVRVYFHPFVPSQLHLVCPAPLSLCPCGGKKPLVTLSHALILSRAWRSGTGRPYGAIAIAIAARSGNASSQGWGGLYRTVRRQTLRDSVTVGHPEKRGNASHRTCQARAYVLFRIVPFVFETFTPEPRARPGSIAVSPRSPRIFSHPGVPNFLRGGKGPVTNDARRFRPDDDPCFETTTSAQHAEGPNSQDKGSR